MNLNEATALGLPRVRRPNWPKGAYLKLSLLGNGMRGPWLRLYDRVCQEAIGEPTPQVIIAIGEVSDFEEYTGVLDESDDQEAAKC